MVRMVTKAPTRTIGLSKHGLSAVESCLEYLFLDASYYPPRIRKSKRTLRLPRGPRLAAEKYSKSTRRRGLFENSSQFHWLMVLASMARRQTLLVVDKVEMTAFSVIIGPSNMRSPSKLIRRVTMAATAAEAKAMDPISNIHCPRSELLGNSCLMAD